MSTHRFTVNIPNPDNRGRSADLRLEPARAPQLRKLGLELPHARLPLEHAGIAKDPCERGERRLKVRLAAEQSVDVYVTVVTGPPADPAVGGVVAFNLVDRGAGPTGGVLLACVDPAPVEPAGNVIPTPNPCPLSLAGDIYAVKPGEDPSVPWRQTLPLGETFDLVAPLTHAGRGRLTNVTAYLEHLGGSDATFRPAAWNLGTLRTGDVFYAIWAVASDGFLVGSFELSIVAESDGKDATRILAPIRITEGSRD